MLKRSATRKLIIAGLSLFVLLIIYLFPDKNTTIDEEIEYQEPLKTSVYLVDKNNYLARTNIVINEKEIIAKAKKIIATLTINSEMKERVPSNFKPIIPENTKVEDISITEDLIKIVFSKELLNVSEKDEEKMIEAIVYSLTELENINKVMIFVGDTYLRELPHSKKVLPQILTRDYGINKVYDLTTFKDVISTTTYYSSMNNDDIYFVPITRYINSSDDKVNIVIENLKSTPLRQTNLMSFLESNATLLDYEILENQVKLTWNNYVFSDITDKKILEEVKYAIALSLKDTLNIKEVVFISDGKETLIIK